MQEIDRKFLERAIALSKANISSNRGGPFGAVIVKDGIVVGEGSNSVTATCDPTAHAEVNAIRNACKNLETYQLNGCVIYSSCEPCPMCLGAIYWARIDKIFFACNKKDAAEVGFDDDFIYKEIALDLNHRSIPTIEVFNTDAIEVFKQWNAKKDKIEY